MEGTICMEYKTLIKFATVLISLVLVGVGLYLLINCHQIALTQNQSITASELTYKTVSLVIIGTVSMVSGAIIMLIQYLMFIMKVNKKKKCFTTLTNIS